MCGVRRRVAAERVCVLGLWSRGTGEVKAEDEGQVKSLVRRHRCGGGAAPTLARTGVARAARLGAILIVCSSPMRLIFLSAHLLLFRQGLARTEAGCGSVSFSLCGNKVLSVETRQGEASGRQLQNNRRCALGRLDLLVPTVQQAMLRSSTGWGWLNHATRSRAAGFDLAFRLTVISILHPSLNRSRSRRSMENPFSLPCLSAETLG